MDKTDLLERYEALGEEADYAQAKQLYEQALSEGADARLLLEYGYLLECHGRNAIRRAVAQYERSIELDPSLEKPRYQLTLARAALSEPDEAVALYEQRLAASPGDVREYRFLASAYLAAHQYAEARSVVDAGLTLAADDRTLIEYRGDVRAAEGDPDGALADWRRALDLDPEQISPAYSSAFLLERIGRLGEAAETWQDIIEWLESRGWELQADWPKRELARLRGQL